MPRFHIFYDNIDVSGVNSCSVTLFTVMYSLEDCLDKCINV